MGLITSLSLILLPFFIAYGTFYCLIAYHLLGFLFPLTVGAVTVYLNKARRAVQNQGKPTIEDRYWEVKRERKS